VEGVKKALVASVISLLFVTAAFGLWALPPRPVILRTHSLNVRVTWDGKPQSGSRFELHKSITFDWEEARRTRAFEIESLKSASTDSRGLLSFGEVKPGRYWIVPRGGSVSDSVPVEVREPSAEGPLYRVLVSHNSEGDLFAGLEVVNPK
jgi:hypothetical protein